MANSELVAQYADSPDIYCLVMWLASNHLWCQVVQGSTHCLSFVSGVNTPTEISDFDFSETKEQVLGFNVSVEDVSRMQVL